MKATKAFLDSGPDAGSAHIGDPEAQMGVPVRPAPVMPPACVPDAAPTMTAGTVSILIQYHAQLVALVKTHRGGMEGRHPTLASVYRGWVAEDQDTARFIVRELRDAGRSDVADRLAADMARESGT